MIALSLGWGVQSFTLAALSALGELPKLDAAIHSDTTHEREATYAFAAQWTPWLIEHGIQVATVRNEARGGTDVVIGGNETPIPARTLRDGNGGRMHRQCTNTWKIQPIRRYLQEHRNGQPVELWLGISTDEWHRAKDADVGYITHRFPLLELGMSRADCLNWLEAHGLPSPGKSSCTFCLAGETEVVTRDGIRQIKDLVGTSPELLVPIVGTQGGVSEIGSFRPAPVSSFGTQRLWAITLRRTRTVKTIYATAEHRWVLAPESQWRQQEALWRTTEMLQSGDRLRNLRSTVMIKEQAMPFALAQGFVFGDGSCSPNDNRPASLTIHKGHKEVMLPLFASCNPVEVVNGYGKAVWSVYGLPRTWKQLPDIRESRSFLASWLAGYFAADGTVGANGQMTLYSATYEHLAFARSVAVVLSIRTAPIRSRIRQGFGGASVLHSLSLNIRDIPDWFLQLSHHRERYESMSDVTRNEHWVVTSVEPTGRIEEVYCATVEDKGAFGLADGLMTGNCPFLNRRAWEEMKRAGGADWQHAVEVDNAIRDVRLPGQLFVHPKLLPLEQAVVIPEDSGYSQLEMLASDDDDAECDSGHCFV